MVRIDGTRGRAGQSTIGRLYSLRSPNPLGGFVPTVTILPRQDDRQEIRPVDLCRIGRWRLHGYAGVHAGHGRSSRCDPTRSCFKPIGLPVAPRKFGFPARRAGASFR